MRIFETLWDLLAGAAASAFAPWLGVAAIATVATFFVATAARDAIDAALSAADRDAADADERKATVAPEVLWTYGNAYLDYFVQRTAAVTVWGSPALELYWKFVLRADVVFAVSLAASIVLFWLAIGTVFWAPPWLCGLAMFAAFLGALYGVADVAEDLKLVAILRDPRKTIDPAQAAAANFLTRLKFVTILLSVVGVLFFIVLSVVNKAAPRLFGIFPRLVRPCWRLAQRGEQRRGGDLSHQ
jgi:hypothetical protein